MVNVPALLLLLLIVAICLKTHVVHRGSVLLGTAVGVVLASTTIGPALIQAVTAVSTATLGALAGLAG